MDPRAAELIASLRRNPDDQAAYAALRDHYARLGDYPSMANLVEGWAGRLSDPGAAARSYMEAGELAANQLRDSARAAKLYEQAAARDPRNLDVLNRLFQLAEATGDPNRMLEALRRRGALQVESRDMLGLADTEHRIGQLYEHQYARPDKAIAHYRKAFEADPTLVAAIYAAREIYNSAGNHKAAAQLLELEAKSEPDTGRKIQLLRELAHLRGQQLGDSGGAIAALQLARQAAPSDLAVLHELATALFHRAGQGGDAAGAEADRGLAADLMVTMARDVPPDHAIAYCGSALDAVPGHEDALALLEHLAGEQGRNDILPVRWVGYLQAVPSGEASNRRRRSLGFAYAAAGQTPDALTCLEPLLNSGDAEIADTLVNLYRSAGRSSDALRALQVSASLKPPAERAARLHEVMNELSAAGRHEDAAECARQVLEADPDDAHALGVLEARYRQVDDWPALRDLMVSASRRPGLSAPERVARLREAAQISESHLRDTAAAIEAYRAIGSLDPADAEAPQAITRLLRGAERWDELAAHLDEQALTLVDPDEKVSALRELAQLHREKRQDPPRAIVALRAILQLHPGDAAATADLSDALLETEDGVPEGTRLLEGRAAEAPTPGDRVALLERLLDTYENRLGDDIQAFETARRLLRDAPAHLAALDAMERIDERGGDRARLIETLSYRSEVVEGKAKVEAHVRLGEVAREHGDLERSGTAYAKALDLDPSRGDVLDALCSVYEQGGRFSELVGTLKSRAASESDAAAAREIHRRIARVLGDELKDATGAIVSWKIVLEGGEDAEALSALVINARVRDVDDELAALLERLGAALQPGEEQRDVFYERAEVLARLNRNDDAILQLQQLLDLVDGGHLASMELLVQLCEASGDTTGLAKALERKLALFEDPGMKLPLTKRLADIYQHELKSTDAAIDALYAWQSCDETDYVCRERLAELLTQAARHEELVVCLDGLAGLEPDEETKGALVRRAASVAATELGDASGAWARLEPRIDFDHEADAQLAQLAQGAGQEKALVDVYTRRANGAPSQEEAARRWRDAARTYERLSETPNALEAMLRAYALDLADLDMLSEVDRLAAAATAWPRLAQVYDRVVGTVTSTEAKVSLLLRHASILEDQANLPSEALDRVLRAAALVPADMSLMERAEKMAPPLGRADELLHVYDTRKTKATTDEDRVDAILRATDLCYRGLNDPERAMQYLAQGVALSLRTPDLRIRLEEHVVALESSGVDGAIKRLADLYVMLGDDAIDDPINGGELLLRAGMLHEERLGDPAAAFELLKKATATASVASTLDVLDAHGKQHGRSREIEAHYRLLIEETIDSRAVAELGIRQATLLDGVLDDAAGAAEAYRRVLTVERTPEVVTKFLAALRRSGNTQDLLIALDREIASADTVEERLPLLREAALVWQHDLDNRYEAIDAWKRVLREDRGNAEATEAIASLERNERIDTSEIMLPEAQDAGATAGLVAESLDDALDSDKPSGDTFREDITDEGETESAEPFDDEGLDDTNADDDVPENAAEAVEEAEEAEEVEEVDALDGSETPEFDLARDIDEDKLSPNDIPTQDEVDLGELSADDGELEEPGFEPLVIPDAAEVESVDDEVSDVPTFEEDPGTAPSFEKLDVNVMDTDAGDADPMGATQEAPLESDSMYVEGEALESQEFEMFGADDSVEENDDDFGLVALSVGEVAVEPQDESVQDLSMDELSVEDLDLDDLDDLDDEEFVDELSMTELEEDEAPRTSVPPPLRTSAPPPPPPRTSAPPPPPGRISVPPPLPTKE